MINLTHLTLSNCTSTDVDRINNYYKNSTKLLYLHVTIRKSDIDIEDRCLEKCDILFIQLLFTGRMCTLQKVTIEPSYGLSLSKWLIPHQSRRYFNIVLQRIDDLYILLNGLLPNIDTIIAQLIQSRLSICHRPQCKEICPRLVDFTLKNSCNEINLDDIKCILRYMSNLCKLTLSIHDTPDRRFCNGIIIESMLNEYLPFLEKFDYTMTQQINNQTLIKDFTRWIIKIVFYENENKKWIHMFSLPSPSSRDDKREVPQINDNSNQSITSDVKYNQYINHLNITSENQMLEINQRFSRVHQIITCLSIHMKLSARISKLILSEQTPVSSMNFLPQENIRHLIVKRRLIDETEISILAHQFPFVKYLELLFPLEKSVFLRCFQTLFSLTDNNEKRCFWSEMFLFHTRTTYEQSFSIYTSSQLHYWLVSNTDMKFWPNYFVAECSSSKFSIWL